jgi:hypothetical protein
MRSEDLRNAVQNSTATPKESQSSGIPAGCLGQLPHSRRSPLRCDPRLLSANPAGWETRANMANTELALIEIS